MKTNILWGQVLGLTFALGVWAPAYSEAQVSAPSNSVAECISGDDIAIIAHDFPQFTAYAGTPLCDDGSKDFIYLSTLNKIRTLQFENVLPLSSDDLYQKRFTFQNGWYSYFVERIHTLKDSTGIGPCAESESVVAYVHQFSGGGNPEPVMYACPSFFDKRMMILEKVSVLLHEARHKDGFPHMMCTQGPRKNEPGACDRQISDKGSYAVSVESLSQIAKYAKGINPAMQLFASSSAVGYASEAFEVPIKINQDDYLLLKTQDSKLVKVNANLGVEKLIQPMGAGRLINKNDFTVMLPTDRSQKAVIFANMKLEIMDTASKTVDQFNAATLDEKAKWVDINYGKALSIIKKNEVEFICDTKNLDTRVKLALPAGQESLSMIYPFDKADITKTSDYLLMKSGRILELSCDKQFKPHMKVSALKLNRSYVRLVNIKGLVFGLGSDGKLYSIKNNIPKLVPSTKAMTFSELVPRHAVLFFQ